MTRARAGGTGVERFGYVGRGVVRRHYGLSGSWRATRALRINHYVFDTWAEALAYALGKDETDDRETE